MRKNDMKKKASRIALYSSAAAVAMVGLLALATRHHKLTPSELVDYAQDKIVVLNGPSNPNSGGTGFEVVAPSGKVYTMTNRHVCGLAENGIMSAQTKYHERTVLLRVLEISKDHDLCILEGIPNAKGYKVNDQEADNYDHLYVIGHPHLAPNTYSEGLVRERAPIMLPDEEAKTEAECLAKPNHSVQEIVVFIFKVKMCFESMDSMSTSVVIYPGNSGSPIFNDNNKVVGVVFASSSRDNYGHYVPLQYLTKLLSRY